MRKITRYFARGTAAAALAAGFALGPMVVSAQAQPANPCADYSRQQSQAFSNAFINEQMAGWYAYYGRPDLAFPHQQLARYWRSVEFDAAWRAEAYGC